MGASNKQIKIEGLFKSYSPDTGIVLENLNLEINRGEFLAIVGASGCGKSTLLNLVAGLDEPTAGNVEVHGRTTLMFQESALLPWLTAGENVELPMRLAGQNREVRSTRTKELLEMVNLSGAAAKMPHELSGGMKQRVAIARALAQEAEILLMDEPFAALDAITRDLLHEELSRIWSERGLTVIFVTHNVREAVRLGQRVLLMSSRPGRFVAEWPVDIPSPRRMDSTEIANMASTITDELRAEIRKHANASR